MDIVTTAEAAVLLNRSVGTIADLARDGSLPPLRRIGSGYIFDKATVLAYRDAHPFTPHAGGQPKHWRELVTEALDEHDDLP
jgi:excisionase family DNA binding protein